MMSYPEWNPCEVDHKAGSDITSGSDSKSQVTELSLQSNFLYYFIEMFYAHPKQLANLMIYFPFLFLAIRRFSGKKKKSYIEDNQDLILMSLQENRVLKLRFSIKNNSQYLKGSKEGIGIYPTSLVKKGFGSPFDHQKSYA